MHSSLNFGSTKSRLKTAFAFSYTKTKSHLPLTDLTSFIRLAPNAPDLLDENGNLSWNYNNTPIYLNPLANLLQDNNSDTDNLVGSINVDYRILKNLIFKISFGYTTMKRNELTKRPLASMAPINKPSSLNRSSNFSNNATYSWITEPQLTYNKKISHGNFNALVGLSFQENESDFRTVTASNFNSDELMGNISSAALFNISQSIYSKYRYNAIFARLNYSLQNQYIINLTARRDGSSRFGSGNQFANFGAAGFAWLFSENSFFKTDFPF